MFRNLIPEGQTLLESITIRNPRPSGIFFRLTLSPLLAQLVLTYLTRMKFQRSIGVWVVCIAAQYNHHEKTDPAHRRRAKFYTGLEALSGEIRRL